MVSVLGGHSDVPICGFPPMYCCIVSKEKDRAYSIKNKSKNIMEMIKIPTMNMGFMFLL